MYLTDASLMHVGDQQNVQILRDYDDTHMDYRFQQDSLAQLPIPWQHCI